MTLIQEGRVTFNGQVQREPSTPVDPAKDKVLVDGQPVGVRKLDYVILYKPKDVTSTRADRFAEKTVIDILPPELAHLNPVGRLDKDTEGLLLCTNDGDLLLKMTHPRFHVEKVYEVSIGGLLNEEQLRRLQKGVAIEGKLTLPAKITNVHTSNNRTEFLMTIREGRKRQIRVMLAKVGRQVQKLKRVRQGPLTLGSLKPGEFRRLTDSEIRQLKESVRPPVVPHHPKNKRQR
jgi:pseudouridine synthase